MNIKRSFQWALLSALTGLAACGSDDFTPGDTGTKTGDAVAPHDGAPAQDGPAAQRDLGQADLGARFFIQGRILFDPNIGCLAANEAVDCKGTLYWGIWPNNPTQPDPGPPIYFAAVADAQHGTQFSASGVPVVPEMYLVAFVDDNDSVGGGSVPWPDQGDPLHMDLEPFSASGGQTVLKEITFWARMP